MRVLPLIAYPSNRSPLGYCINGCRRRADIDEFNSNQQQQLGGQVISYNNISQSQHLFPFLKFTFYHALLIIIIMQESSDSDYNVQVKQEDEMLEQSSSPHLQKPSNKPFILLQEDDSDQLHFYRNKCKKKKKNRLQIMNLNMGRWNRQQQKSFHLLLEVSFRTFINRMVFNKHFKMFARRREFLKMRSHGQTRGFLQKLQRKQNKSYIEIIGGYRRQFYNSLDPQHVQNELSKRGIQFEKILTIQQLQKLFNQTKELKKYMLNAKANENMLEMATAKAKKLKQLEQKKQEEQREKQKLRQKQAQEMREMMERYDPKNKKSKQSEYIPKKSKIICFTMDPLTFEIINKKQIEE